MERLKKAKRLETLNLTSDQIFDMDQRYNPLKFNKTERVFYSGREKIKFDPPYRGKGYKDVAGSMAAFPSTGARPASDAGRKANTYRANRDKFDQSYVRLHERNEDAVLKDGSSTQPIRLNRSLRWSDASSYGTARSVSPSNLKVH